MNGRFIPTFESSYMNELRLRTELYELSNAGSSIKESAIINMRYLYIFRIVQHIVNAKDTPFSFQGLCKEINRILFFNPEACMAMESPHNRNYLHLKIWMRWYDMAYKFHSPIIMIIMLRGFRYALKFRDNLLKIGYILWRK